MSYAGVGRRGVAILIDGVMFLILGIPVSIVSGGIDSGTRTSSGGTTSSVSFRLGPGGVVLTVLLWLAYMTLAESRGVSVGKLATGLRVVKEDGFSMDLQAALIRNLLRFVDGLFFYLVGILLAVNSPKKQRLGDRAAHTIVVPAELIGRGVPRPDIGSRPDRL